MANKQIVKKWHNANIQNNFVFGKTMELYPDLCRRLLELILNTIIKEISYPEREKTIEARTNSKGIRLDVYVEEKGTNRSFDEERGRAKEREALAIKLIRRGRPFDEIHEDTGLPLQRIQELAKSNLDG